MSDYPLNQEIRTILSAAKAEALAVHGENEEDYYVTIHPSEFVEVGMRTNGFSIEVTDPKTGVKAFLFKENHLMDPRFYDWARGIAAEVLAISIKANENARLEREAQTEYFLNTVQPRIKELQDTAEMIGGLDTDKMIQGLVTDKEFM